eukprot:CAMPEP_0206376866 /NCGR_PEP_ID=MMETSP0294-20121207/9763_1 /ASSEMBLY_ACC=CAM_ASM_000327 /TAXON_ID=39354 /ORGANISM="Heterosigma akashiwo, Strain CCMP2393" /LENGTH=85 /DNA_ID=CAMNT_0053825125 /DNA_START=124 /DNA_END=381 /DNA_ORIENTATION=+
MSEVEGRQKPAAVRMGLPALLQEMTTQMLDQPDPNFSPNRSRMRSRTRSTTAERNKDIDGMDRARHDSYTTITPAAVEGNSRFWG